MWIWHSNHVQVLKIKKYSIEKCKKNSCFAVGRNGLTESLDSLDDERLQWNKIFGGMERVRRQPHVRPNPQIIHCKNVQNDRVSLRMFSKCPRWCFQVELTTLSYVNRIPMHKVQFACGNASRCFCARVQICRVQLYPLQFAVHREGGGARTSPSPTCQGAHPCRQTESSFLRLLYGS